MKRFRRCLRMDRCPTDMNRADWERERMLAQIQKLRIRYKAAVYLTAHTGQFSRHGNNMHNAFISLLRQYQSRFGHWPTLGYSLNYQPVPLAYARMTGLYQ